MSGQEVQRNVLSTTATVKGTPSCFLQNLKHSRTWPCISLENERSRILLAQRNGLIGDRCCGQTVENHQILRPQRSGVATRACGSEPLNNETLQVTPLPELWSLPNLSLVACLMLHPCKLTCTAAQYESKFQIDACYGRGSTQQPTWRKNES